MSFPAAFPPNCKPLRGGDGEAWRLWLDVYLDDITLAKLNAFARLGKAFTVTVEATDA